MEINFPERKPNRLKNHDYSSGGAYFLTICTAEKRNYFWNNVGATIGRPQDVELSPFGIVVDEAIKHIPIIYPSISLERYVIMPDHVHLLLRVRVDASGRPMVAPTMSRVVQQMKGYVTKQAGTPIWQKLFFDHVIRSQQDYDEHMKYIYENPMRRRNN
ncbi:MAG: transposase [Clostridia bacterium]|nr:transposase [Clostridia bacterium]